MKTNTKFFATAVIALAIFTVGASAQTTDTTMMAPKSGMDFKIGLGASAGITTKGSPFNYALGADLLLQWKLAKNVALTASGGYTRFMAEDNAVLGDIAFIPAIGGVKVYPGIGNMYLQANAGAAFAIEDGAKTAFLYGGGTGYDWDNGLSIGLRYEGWQQDSSSSTYLPTRASGQFALRIGYNF